MQVVEVEGMNADIVSILSETVLVTVMSEASKPFFVLVLFFFFAFTVV